MTWIGKNLSNPPSNGLGFFWVNKDASTIVGDHFCQDCNRLRLTADGNLRPCLLNDVEIPLLEDLRAGLSIQGHLKQAIDSKPESHELAQMHLPTRRCMQQIGG